MVCYPLLDTDRPLLVTIDYMLRHTDRSGELARFLIRNDIKHLAGVGSAPT